MENTGKSDYKHQPFLLISSAPWFAECPSSMEDYIELILEENKEGGEKIPFLTWLTGKRNYKNSPEKEYLKNLFGETFFSIENLKEELRNGGLEKTSAAIEMKPVNETKF